MRSLCCAMLKLLSLFFLTRASCLSIPLILGNTTVSSPSPSLSLLYQICCFLEMGRLSFWKQGFLLCLASQVFISSIFWDLCFKLKGRILVNFHQICMSSMWMWQIKLGYPFPCQKRVFRSLCFSKISCQYISYIYIYVSAQD